MSSRRDFYHRQRVTEAELDEAFEALEQADHNFASDLSIRGVISGAVAVPHTPVADLTVDLTAPGRAYDRLGRRVFIAAGQRVDVSRDLNNLPTQVPQVGQERWVGIYIRFSRLLSEPRTDGNGQVVYWKRDESFEVVVRQGAAATVGQAQRPSLEPDELLVADVKRRFNQTQIVAADISADRRQVFIFSPADNVSVEADGWTVLDPAAETVQSTLDIVDEVLSDHFAGTQHRHTAGAVNAVTHGFLTQTTVQGQLDQVVDVLAGSTVGNAGAKHVGADAVAGTPFALSAGTVDAQLSTLNSHVNSHATSTSAHAAESITAAVHAHIAGTNVQSQLQEIVSDLSTTSVGASGAERVGVDAISGNPSALTAGTLRSQLAALLLAINGHVNAASGAHAASAVSVADASNRLNAGSVEAALNEVVEAFEADHFRGNQDTPGQHRAIRQPAFAASGMALLWDARGVGGARMRAYLDSTGLWLTINAASSNGVQWTKDVSSSFSCALRLTSNFSLLYNNAQVATFVSWTREYHLPMASATNNSGWLVTGAIQEQGRVGMETLNTHTAARQVVMGTSVTFRSENANVQSLTFTMLDSLNVAGRLPTMQQLSTTGFHAQLVVDSLNANTHARWLGTYTVA